MSDLNRSQDPQIGVSEGSSAPLPQPESWERGAAAAIHIISIPAPLWGPLLAGLIMKSRSRYAEVHAWKALREHIILSACLLVWGTGSLIFTLTRLYGHWQNDWATFNPWEFLIRFAIGWIILTILTGIVTVLSVIQAWGAWQGSWPKNEIKKALRRP
jgi:hypothetical protein